ncbi:MAG TPA: type VI secretion system-associated FHA domain protein [Planctomycetota bacterium]|nr:type VI secretion system-associated FHA domain protein [Planctomycetota bacterium]
MSIRLLLKQKGADGKTLQSTDYDVEAGNPLTFGRAEGQNRLHLADDKKMISSRHGRIERRADGYYVVDLGSLNGTTIDGRTVKGEAGELLTDGCTIGVGGYDLRVFLTAAKATGAPAKVDPESTLFSFDPEQLATQAFEAACARFLADRRLPAAERRQQLLAELRQRLQRLSPPQARAVLKRVLARAGAGDSGGSSGVGEELLQAGFSELQRLAQSLVAERQFTSAKDIARFAQLVQAFFQLTLRWVVQCMQARAEFENQFGAEVTMVFQRSNNPLKGLEPEDLGKNLLDWSGDRDITAVRNQLEGVYRDLTQHQLGLLVGVKEAIAAVMARLSPEAIETLAQKDAGWLTSKGAKAWEVYRQIYRELLEEKSKLFHEVISPAIRQGYLQSHQDGSGRKTN